MIFVEIPIVLVIIFALFGLAFLKVFIANIGTVFLSFIIVLGMIFLAGLLIILLKKILGNKGIVFGVVIVVISLCCFFYTTSMYDAYRTNKSVMAETSSNTTITIPSGSVVKLSSLYVYQGKMNCVYKNSAGEKFNVKILEKDMDYCGKLDMFWHLYPQKK